MLATGIAGVEYIGKKIVPALCSQACPVFVRIEKFRWPRTGILMLHSKGTFVSGLCLKTTVLQAGCQLHPILMTVLLMIFGVTTSIVLSFSLLERYFCNSRNGTKSLDPAPSNGKIGCR